MTSEDPKKIEEVVAPILGEVAPVEAAAQRALTRLKLPLRHFLFRGGLPTRLLPTARVLCAETDAELDAACKAAGDERDGDGDAANGGGSGGDGSNAFDWSLVDWSVCGYDVSPLGYLHNRLHGHKRLRLARCLTATLPLLLCDERCARTCELTACPRRRRRSADDPFAACNAASAASPVPRACELRALRLVDAELERRVARLRPAPVMSAAVQPMRHWSHANLEIQSRVHEGG